jgi:hypothetical protein
MFLFLLSSKASPNTLKMLQKGLNSRRKRQIFHIIKSSLTKVPDYHQAWY